MGSPEAIKKRLARRAKKVGAAAVKYVKSHRRKESLAEKLLLGPQDFGMDAGAVSDDLKDMKDPEKRKELKKKARQQQRRKSRQLIKSKLGNKEHFSDEDVQEEKPQRTKYTKKKRGKGDDDYDFDKQMK